MPNVKYTEALKNLKAKKFEPLYFFHGEESFFIDELVKEIEQNALDEAQKSFNQTIIYGKDVATEPGKIIDNAMRLPMMAEKQVVIVKEAQNIKNWDAIGKYASKPTQSTILVFAHKNKKLDGRSAFAKDLKKTAVVVESNPFRDYQVPDWVNEYVQAQGFKIDPKSAQLLTDFLGTDLSKISNELEKLFLVMDQKTITPEEIEENIGISKDYNVFELQNALMEKNVSKVFRIMDYFKQNPKAGNIVFVTAMLYSLYSKLYTLNQIGNATDKDKARLAKIPPFFLKDYLKALKNYTPQAIRRNIHLLKEYDMRGKGLNNVNTSSGELLKELSFKLMMK